MDKERIIRELMDSAPEYFTKTMDLRYVVTGFKHIEGPFGISQREDVMVLQQKHQGNRGSVKWVDVEITLPESAGENNSNL